MKRTTLEDATPGMVLAKPVTNATGMTILPIGTVLDKDLIARLDRMNIGAVYIEGAASGTEQTLDEQEHALEARFAKVGDDPVQQTIREAIRRHVRALYAAAHPDGAAATEGGARA